MARAPFVVHVTGLLHSPSLILFRCRATPKRPSPPCCALAPPRRLHPSLQFSAARCKCYHHHENLWCTHHTSNAHRQRVCSTALRQAVYPPEAHNVQCTTASTSCFKTISVCYSPITIQRATLPSLTTPSNHHCQLARQLRSPYAFHVAVSPSLLYPNQIDPSACRPPSLIAASPLHSSSSVDVIASNNLQSTHMHTQTPRRFRALRLHSAKLACKHGCATEQSLCNQQLVCRACAPSPRPPTWPGRLLR